MTRWHEEVHANRLQVSRASRTLQQRQAQEAAWLKDGAAPNAGGATLAVAVGMVAALAAARKEGHRLQGRSLPLPQPLRRLLSAVFGRARREGSSTGRQWRLERPAAAAGAAALTRAAHQVGGSGLIRVKCPGQDLQMLLRHGEPWPYDHLLAPTQRYPAATGSIHVCSSSTGAAGQAAKEKQEEERQAEALDMSRRQQLPDAREGTASLHLRRWQISPRAPAYSSYAGLKL